MFAAAATEMGRHRLCVQTNTEKGNILNVHKTKKTAEIKIRITHTSSKKKNFN